jgi:hypothetical protein
VRCCDPRSRQRERLDLSSLAEYFVELAGHNGHRGRMNTFSPRPNAFPGRQCRSAERRVQVEGTTNEEES